ncbi:hypothetical protein CSUB01_02477 [Colletotrichum sublineola]|uniref:DUF202 domain-containing protein n=1 Tax=Colletotrichum sublineola TaxID=1173701 RepID=A0A066WZE2_COLSU|nr:hypothetical protein CSUB01_02477 [Colletotrichum sublineola]
MPPRSCPVTAVGITADRRLPAAVAPALRRQVAVSSQESRIAHRRVHRSQTPKTTYTCACTGHGRLVEIRAVQRTFEGAYMRTALSQFSFALIILKIFTSEFYAIGALFAVYGAAVMLVAIFRRHEGNRQFFTSPKADERGAVSVVRKFRTSGNSVTLLTLLSLAAYVTLLVLTWQLVQRSEVRRRCRINDPVSVAQANGVFPPVMGWVHMQGWGTYSGSKRAASERWNETSCTATAPRHPAVILWSSREVALSTTYQGKGGRPARREDESKEGEGAHLVVARTSM